MKTFFQVICLAGLLAAHGSQVYAEGFSMIERAVVGTLLEDGVKWSLVRQTDGESGALLIMREKDGISEVVAGDSAPFPLSNYGIDPRVAKRLAEIYVDHEIRSSPGGLEMVRQRVAESDEIPHDLHAAYARYMRVSAKPLYGTVKRSVQDMIKALRYVENSRGENQRRYRLLKRLKPLLSNILVKITQEPEQELANHIVSAASKHPGSRELQELSAVLAAHHPQFLEAALDLQEPGARQSVFKALQDAIDQRLVGSVLRHRISEIIP